MFYVCEACRGLASGPGNEHRRDPVTAPPDDDRRIEHLEYLRDYWKAVRGRSLMDTQYHETGLAAAREAHEDACDKVAEINAELVALGARSARLDDDRLIRGHET